MTPELRNFLISQAAKNESIPYGVIMKIFGFSQYQLHIELENVARFENENGRPMLTVMAQYQTGGYGDPFFDLAQEFGFGNSMELKANGFAARMKKQVYEHWKKATFSSERAYYLLGSKYGENADVPKMQDMIAKSVVAVGFYDSDLSQYYLADEEEIRNFLVKKKEPEKSYNALKKFLQLKPGDIVAVKHSGSPRGGEGYLSIGAYAIVVARDGLVYSYDPNDLGHCINVEFVEFDLNREFKKGGYGRTIAKIEDKETIAELFNGYLEKDEGLMKKRIRKRRAADGKHTEPQHRKGAKPYVAKAEHNQIQLLFSQSLINKYGKEKVRIEEDFVDVKLDLGDEITFYEVKPYHLAEDCIKVGLGQLLCYGFFSDDSRTKKLVVVGPYEPSQEEQLFINHLKENSSFNFDYLAFKC